MHVYPVCACSGDIYTKLELLLEKKLKDMPTKTDLRRSQTDLLTTPNFNDRVILISKTERLGAAKLVRTRMGYYLNLHSD
jgi:hypothetical protein